MSSDECEHQQPEDGQRRNADNYSLPPTQSLGLCDGDWKKKNYTRATAILPARIRR